MASHSPQDVRRPEREERTSCSEVSSAGSSALVALRDEGSKRPLFLIHGVDRTLRPFQHLVRYILPVVLLLGFGGWVCGDDLPKPNLVDAVQNLQQTLVDLQKGSRICNPR
jgi:hypothetical protein